MLGQALSKERFATETIEEVKRCSVLYYFKTVRMLTDYRFKLFVGLGGQSYISYYCRNNSLISPPPGFRTPGVYFIMLSACRGGGNLGETENSQSDSHGHRKAVTQDFLLGYDLTILRISVTSVGC